MKKRAAIMAAVCGLVLFSLYSGMRREEQARYVMGKTETLPVVVIDAGHGGKDPGKIGVNGAQEKEINLSIAKKLEQLLKQNDVAVVMTRCEDKDLASETAENRKNEDLRERVRKIEEAQPVLAVSIHQNSYPEEEVSGAQVFYYTDSEQGKRLGKILQARLKEELNDENHRVAKASKEYYLLKRSSVPTVIVECGFLSNEKEAELLTQEEYQEKIAFSLLLGIMEYINTTDG